MSNTEIDESRAYREYFELVKRFNLAEGRYVASLNEANKRKHAAIQQAVKDHLDPLLAKLRQVQLISVGVAVGAFLFLCVTLSAESYGVGLLVLLLIAAIGVAGAVWSTRRISNLNNETRWYRENLPRPPG